MAKRKKAPATDQHKSKGMVRLPDKILSQLRKLKERDRIPITAAVVLAVEKLLAERGLWPPQ